MKKAQLGHPDDVGGIEFLDLPEEIQDNVVEGVLDIGPDVDFSGIVEAIREEFRTGGYEFDEEGRFL